MRNFGNCNNHVRQNTNTREMKMQREKDAWENYMPDDILFRILEKAHERYETDARDYHLLNRMRLITKGVYWIITRSMMNAKKLPHEIFDLLESEKLQEIHPNLEVWQYCKRNVDCGLHLKNLKNYIYTSPIHFFNSTKIESITVKDNSLFLPQQMALFYNLDHSLKKLVFCPTLKLPTTSLKELTNLTSLRVNYNVPMNAFIQQFPSLLRLSIKSFGVGGAPTNDALRFSTNLTKLDMRGNETISDDAFLQFSHLQNLMVLYANAELTDDSIEKLTNLRHLILPPDSRVDISLSKLTNLTILTAPALISRITLIGLARSLTSLDLSQCYTEISHDTLSLFTSLKSLTVQNYWYDKSRSSGYFNSFPRLTNLTRLSLKENNCIKEEYITGLSNLTELDLRGNFIISDTTLLSLTNLRYVFLPKNMNLSFEQLMRMKNLIELTVPRDFDRINIPPHIYIREQEGYYY